MKKLGLLFHHSSGRTPNFSVHQLSCLKCIKARRAVQLTEWNAVVLFVLLRVCVCICRRRSIVITKACLAQTVLLLQDNFAKLLFCFAVWMQLQNDLSFILGTTVPLSAWILASHSDWCLILNMLLFWCKVEVKIVILHYCVDIFLRNANPISDDFVNMCQVDQAFSKTLVRNSRNSNCNQCGCTCLCEADLNWWIFFSLSWDWFDCQFFPFVLKEKREVVVLQKYRST